MVQFIISLFKAAKHKCFLRYLKWTVGEILAKIIVQPRTAWIIIKQMNGFMKPYKILIVKSLVNNMVTFTDGSICAGDGLIFSGWYKQVK